jgi:hypothetical protein
MKDSQKRKIINKVVNKFKTPINPKQLSEGLEVEKEHTSFNEGKAGKATDVVRGNKTKIAKIAVVHLKEDPKYYTKLEKAGL